jgi:hypothetical protein
MISKRTKVLAVLFVLCGVFVSVAEYKDFRRYQEIRASWRGQEYAMQLLEQSPRASAGQSIIFYRDDFASSCVRIIAYRCPTSPASNSKVICGYHFWKCATDRVSP